MTRSCLLYAALRVKYFSFVVLLFFIFTSSCTHVFGRNIAFFYAMDADWKSLCEGMEATPSVRQWGGRTIFEINAGPDRILAVKMESGCVQSAISAQAVLTFRKIDLAVSVGPVGSLSPDLKIGEWAVVDRIIPWQKQSVQSIDLKPARGVESQNASVRSDRIVHLRKISVASGEQFVASLEIREEIYRSTGCLSIDMNLFGLATALSVNGVPAIHLRVVSDRADERARADFERFVENYAGEGGRMTAEMIKSLPADMTQPSQHPGLRKLLTQPPQE